MKNYRESLKEELKNPEFQKEWLALDEEFRQIRQSLNVKPKNSVHYNFFRQFYRCGREEYCSYRVSMRCNKI